MRAVASGQMHYGPSAPRQVDGASSTHRPGASSRGRRVAWSRTERSSVRNREVYWWPGSRGTDHPSIDVQHPQCMWMRPRHLCNCTDVGRAHSVDATAERRGVTWSWYRPKACYAGRTPGGNAIDDTISWTLSNNARQLLLEQVPTTRVAMRMAFGTTFGSSRC